jgi:hypothetical protein
MALMHSIAPPQFFSRERSAGKLSANATVTTPNDVPAAPKTHTNVGIARSNSSLQRLFMPNLGKGGVNAHAEIANNARAVTLIFRLRQPSNAIAARVIRLPIGA